MRCQAAAGPGTDGCQNAVGLARQPVAEGCILNLAELGTSGGEAVMGLFKRKSEEPAEGGPSADRMALARQWQEQAKQMQAQATQFQAQAMQQAAALQHAAAPQQGSPAGPVAEAGSMTWARQVLAILAPPQPGFVKRCTCAVCGAPKKLPTVTAYVYCDYCASLIDYDLRRAGEGDTAPDPAYAATVNGTHAAARAGRWPRVTAMPTAACSSGCSRRT